MVGYCYANYECWSGASISENHFCRHKFTDMTAGKMQIHGKWTDAIVTDMADGWVHVKYMNADKMKL